MDDQSEKYKKICYSQKQGSCFWFWNEGVLKKVAPFRNIFFLRALMHTDFVFKGKYVTLITYNNKIKY